MKIEETVKDVFAYLDENWDGTEEEPANGYWEEMHRQHGAVVEYRQEAYYDVRIWEDGLIERIPIGD